MALGSNSLRLPDPNRVYRVAQWATGRIGVSALRELIRSPQFELVGVYVHSEAKEGVDAGELCGLPPTGVKATRSIQAIIAAKPDCVIAVQDGANVDDVCRFLEAGVNIATSRVDYLEPERMDPEVRRRVEEACRKGGSSIHATGSSPGFISEILPLAALSMSRRMDGLTIDEFAHVSLSCPDFQCQAMGFGSPVTGQFDPGLLHHHAHGFEQSLSVVAKALGLSVERFEVFGEMAGAKARFLLPGGTPVEQGTMAAQRITIAAICGGKPLLRFRINWYVSTDIDQDWYLRENGWRLVIEGETPLDVQITFPMAVTDPGFSPAMAGITAYSVVNAAPFVVEAEPGIRTTAELPAIVPRMACG